ncbi:E3 ubiquitin-protein ligase RNF31-like [Brachyhypopomus gauderio]|uniref:E3 ubiquitin-protein ligase RNF31-like n=1 Tax=Brachyhypopomus gauderio TaxID=698409 RepID=UPI004041907F
MSSLDARFEELRSRAESCLATSSSVEQARPLVTAMAETDIPVSSRYRNIPAENIIMENITGKNQKEVLESLRRLIKALNILVKYGCNLTNPKRPLYWRTVKYNNPVFKSVVDIIKGSRNVLGLYGYTTEMPDCIMFPEEVTSPNVQKVAAVATEVMTLSVELDLLIKGTHSHPEFFERSLPLLQQEQEKDYQEIISDAIVFHTPPEKCAICGVSSVSSYCISCTQRLCTECDRLYHSHPARADHERETVSGTPPFTPVIHSSCAWRCVHCTTVNVANVEVCTSCQTPCLTSPATVEGKGEWTCMSCTTLNSSTTVLCEVCEYPHLPKQNISLNTNPQSCTGTEWECQKCTFVNLKPALRCEMCDMPQEDIVSKNINLLSPLPSKDDVISLKKSQDSFTTLDIKNQESIRKDGLKLLHHLKQGEKKGFGPEEVYAALQASGGSGVFDWMHSELPHLLEEICALAASVQLDCKTEHAGTPTGSGEQHNTEIRLSKAEAKQAWVASEGNTQKAVAQLLSDRATKLHALMSMGFVDKLACEEALFISAGDLDGALSHLQCPLLQPLHKHIWTEKANINFDINHDDKEWLCCRLLGLYNLPSWGRCQLALSLLQEPDVEFSLEDVIHAVREHHDKDFINRILKNECTICYGIFPQRKMHSLISCQCSMCTECFKQHFTVVLRDKHIRDMVCPACEEPDINHPDALDNYFSILDVQLRTYLEPEIHELFGKKLMEHAVMKDPKFLWCCHCTNGFINDKDELKVTCPNCQQSFCSKCKKPWEEQHEGLSCNDFQAWKRENDPDYQKQGLAGFLRDNGINCPSCKFQYALAKGGCMHFTCSQCRHEFCCGCNNPFHKKGCTYAQCTVTGLHAHHPRDCLSYLRDWEPARLQDLLKMGGVKFNTDADGTATDECGVMEQKDGAQVLDAPCGVQTVEGHAGLCIKHYREYLVSLINAHSLDPAYLFDEGELISACKRHQVNCDRVEDENDETYHARLRQKLMEIPLGEKVPRKI